MWDDVYSDCDYTDNVDCGDRPYPDGSTSPHPPTTSTSSSTSSTLSASSTSSTLTSSSTTTSYISSTMPPSTSSETPTSASETTSNLPQPTGKFNIVIHHDLKANCLGSYPGLPDKVLGMYILLADDFEEG